MPSAIGMMSMRCGPTALGTGGITVRGPSGFSRWFNDNQRFGIWAVSRGAITLTNISANE